MTRTLSVSVLPITYPFELVRVRMALETKQADHPLTLYGTLTSIYHEQPRHLGVPSRLSHFYRGFTIPFLGTVPYRGGMFLIWETFNARSDKWFLPSFRQKHRHKFNLIIGAVAGVLAQTATYHLEVVRRIQ